MPKVLLTKQKCFQNICACANKLLVLLNILTANIFLQLLVVSKTARYMSVVIKFCGIASQYSENNYIWMLFHPDQHPVDQRSALKQEKQYAKFIEMCTVQ